MPRFQKITTIYPDFEVALRRQNPDYASLSYQEIYDRLIAQSYSWSDFFARNLRQRGYDAKEQFANCEILQKAWARENNVRFSRRKWVSEIALSQIQKFQPDVLLLEDLYVSDADFRARAREVCKPNLRMIGWRAAPTNDYTILRDLDLVLTCAPVFVDDFRRNGIRTDLMSHGFQPSILDQVEAITADLDFTFVGMISLANGYHRQRYSHVTNLIEKTPLEVWGEIVPASSASSRNLLTRLANRANRAVHRLKHRSAVPVETRAAPVDPVQQRHPGRFHPSVFGMDNFRLLRRSRVTFNCHIDSADTSAGNMRLFEATGVGTCLVTDSKKNLPQLFEPDVEVVTYGNIDECIEKVNYLLDHRDARERIAMAGQKRTLRDHTYERRAEQLDQIIQKLVAGEADRTRSHFLSS